MSWISAAAPFACREVHPMPCGRLPMSTAETVRVRSGWIRRRRSRREPDRQGHRVYTIFLVASSSNDELNEKKGLLLRAADLIGNWATPITQRMLVDESEEVGTQPATRCCRTSLRKYRSSTGDVARQIEMAIGDLSYLERRQLERLQSTCSGQRETNLGCSRD